MYFAPFGLYSAFWGPGLGVSFPVYQAIIIVHATLPIEDFQSHWGWGPCSRLVNSIATNPQISNLR
jgi:hypothetical protein